MQSQAQSYSAIEIKEEIANVVTHGIGLLLSLLGLAWLLSASLASGDVWKIVCASVFGGSLVLLYSSSTLYHSVMEEGLKLTLRMIDHCAIYILIAGSYTPFALVTIGGSWGWTLFGIVWGLAFVGILAKIFFFGRWRLLSTLFYIGMGWLIVIDVRSLVDGLPLQGCVLLLAGGLSYTFGAIIYSLKRPVYHHAIWHLFCVGGSVCHYFAVLHFVL